MMRDHDLERRLRRVEERETKLCGAARRMNETLDLDEVLKRVAEGARELTGADIALVSTRALSDGAPDLTASGIKPEDVDRIREDPEGTALMEHLDAVEEPLRVDDLAAYAESRGILGSGPPAGAAAFLSVALRRRGGISGKLHVAKTRPGELFDPCDEDALVLFASHAAPAVENARRFGEERRARICFEALMDSSSVGVVVVDRSNRFPRLMNREAERLADILKAPGEPPESLAGSLNIRRGDGMEFSPLDFTLENILPDDEIVRTEEITMVNPAGRSVNVLVNSSPIVSHAGEVESLVVTLQDMAPLEEVEAFRAEFLGMVSQELRTPLASIEGAAKVMMGSSTELVPSEWRQYLGVIADQAENMRSVIGDLLDVARIDTATLPMNLGPAAVADLVEQSRVDFAGAGGRNVLEIDVAADLPPVMADGQRIVQVIGNLVSNAARNSPAGSVIKLTASLVGGHVEVSVADAGRGVPAENLPQLFGNLYRGDLDERSRRAGLGLAICKGIVEAHGGRIWAVSEGSGLGVRFAFTLAAAPEAAGDRGARPSNLADGADDDVRVLVVDGDPRSLLFVRRTLVDAGFRASATSTPDDVPAMLEAERPDLALLDTTLPGVDGIDLMDDVLGTADIPVILLSDYGRDHVVSRAFERGATDYVVKPFSPTELVARIGAALRRQRAQESAEPRERFVLGDLEIDYAERVVTFGGEPIKLTATEYLLLRELSFNAGRVLTYQQIMRRVWKTRETHDLRSLRTHVTRLRRKMGVDAGDQSYIITEPRVGYRMAKG